MIGHPRTGQQALFVNSVYTTGIEGMDPAEGAALLARLTAHATHPNLTCRLRWEPNMLTIWDNLATQHFAINDYPANANCSAPASAAPPRNPPPDPHHIWRQSRQGETPNVRSPSGV